MLSSGPHCLATRDSTVEHLMVSELPDVCQTIEVTTENDEQSVSSSHAYPLQISPVSPYDSDTNSVHSEEDTKEGLHGLWNICQAERQNSLLKLPSMATFVTSGVGDFKVTNSQEGAYSATPWNVPSGLSPILPSTSDHANPSHETRASVIKKTSDISKSSVKTC